ncbi:MAG TPA: hypothetical protein VJ438_06195 [Candidatus Nanoarchaeia archaeon]|nr:hypothetical protein [Candidatus Nanoarchaeia archaeon]
MPNYPIVQVPERVVTYPGIFDSPAFLSLPTPESAETAIARQQPMTAVNLLQGVARDKTLELANCRGYEVAASCLNKYSKPKLSKISSVQVSTFRERKSIFSSLFGSSERISLDISIT